MFGESDQVGEEVAQRKGGSPPAAGAATNGLPACPFGGIPPPEAGCSVERYQFETLLAEFSARFVNLPAEEVDSCILDSQRQICELLNIDACVLWQWEADNPRNLILTHLYRPFPGPPVPEDMDASVHFPWCLQRALARQNIHFNCVAEAPPEAARDLAGWRHFGVQSVSNFTLATGTGAAFGVISFCEIRKQREWTPLLVRRLHMVADIFANALIRKRNDFILRESEERLALATEAAEAGPWVLDMSKNRFWIGAKTRELLDLPAGEFLAVDVFFTLIHEDDRAEVRQAMRRALGAQKTESVDYRIRRADGKVRWMHTSGRLCPRTGDGHPRLTGITSDITARKESEEKLARALVEVQLLRDQLHTENVYLREHIRTVSQHGGIIGESAPVQRMLSLARKVAPTGSAVLITGETGTGKELLAQAIHDMSPRNGRTMVTVNCAALPAPLIESELFGREKGAYTGAMTQQAGRFQVADGSTIFLDEIGELPLDLQSKLLRVLQDGLYERLGSHRTQKTDVRVIAATNRDLAAMVREGKFREDLYHRLNVFPIVAPPLRERDGDIPLLVWKFVRHFNDRMGRLIESIPKAAMEKLRQYSWPGNVRELRNVIERAMIVSEGRSLQIELAIPERLSAAPPATTLQEVERQHILSTLQRTYWKISGKGGAAEALGMVPTTLQSRMKKLGITRPKV